MLRPALLLLAFLLLPTRTANADSPEESFWQWFQENESRIRETYADRKDSPGGLGTLTGEIGEQFDRLRIDLAFEFGQATDGLFEFIVSAEGISERIPKVRALVGAAPKLEGWRIIAFRPRNPNHDTVGVQMGGIDIYPESVWYKMTPGDGKVDLIVFMRGYEEDKRRLFVGAGFILLDQSLGEYDVMTKVRYIDFRAAPSDPEGAGAMPLPALRADFDSVLPPASP